MAIDPISGTNKRANLQAFTAQPLHATPGSVSEMLKGQFNGKQVQQHASPQSIMQNSMEELSIGISSKLGRNAGKRTQKNDEDIQVVVEDLHESDTENLLKKFTPQQKDTLEKLIQQLFKENKDPQQMMTDLKKSFSDSSDQYLALQVLKLRFLATLNRSSNLGMGDFEKFSKLIGAANEELILLMDTKTADIRAGLNIAEATQEYAAKFAVSAEVLKQFYRSTILRYKTPKELLKYILEKFGADKLDDSMNFLSKSVSTDIQILNSSISKNQLGTIITDLYNLASLKQVYRQTKQLIDQSRKYFKCGLTITTHDLMVSLLDMTEKQWLSKLEVDKYLRTFDAQETKEMIPILNKTKEILRALPLALYADIKTRDKLLMSIGDAVGSYSIQELRNS